MLLGLLLTLNIMVCLALIAVVLLQRSEGGALGSGSPTGLITTRGAGDLLTRTTWILFSLFLVLSLALTLLGGQERSSQAILNRLKLRSVNPDAMPTANTANPGNPASPGTATPPPLLAPAQGAAPAPALAPAPTLSAPAPRIRLPSATKPAARASASKTATTAAAPPAAGAAPPPASAPVPPQPAPKLVTPSPAPLQVPPPTAKPGEADAPVKTGGGP